MPMSARCQIDLGSDSGSGSGSTQLLSMLSVLRQAIGQVTDAMERKTTLRVLLTERRSRVGAAPKGLDI